MSARPKDIEPISPIRVSPNGRHFVDRRGEPVFWLADTQWELFRMFRPDEALQLLENRKSKGFNVILIMLMGTARDNEPPRANVDGETAWVDGDPLKPNEKYFRHVDEMMRLGERTGQTFVVGVYHKWHVDVITESNARAWARWLAARYRTVPNLIWSMYPQAREDFKGVCRELAAGLREGDGGSHLISIHPDPSPASSSFLHSEPWLAFNMIQTWNDYNLIRDMVTSDYRHTPVRPVVMAEGGYETSRKGERVVTAREVRRQAYWTQLAGAYHAYGHDGNWRSPTTWQQWMDSPGSCDLKLFREIITSCLQWWDLVPDQSMLLAGARSGFELNAAARSASGRWALVYLSEPSTVTVRLDGVANVATVHAEWIDPRTGERTPAGTFVPGGNAEFTTPLGWDDALVYMEGK